MSEIYRELLMGAKRFVGRQKTVRTKEPTETQKMAIRRAIAMAQAMGLIDVPKIIVLRASMDALQGEAIKALKEAYSGEIDLSLEKAKELFGEGIDTAREDRYIFDTNNGLSRMKIRLEKTEEGNVVRFWLSSKKVAGKESVIEDKYDDKVEFLETVGPEDFQTAVTVLFDILRENGVELPEDMDLNDVALKMYSEYRGKVESLKEGLKKTDLNDFESLDEVIEFFRLNEEFEDEENEETEKPTE